MRMVQGATGGMETELKLDLEPADLDRVKRHPLLRGGRGSGLRVQKLRSLYFDTADQALRKAGISFRIRSDGNERIQTIKAAAKGKGAALSRREWEHKVESDTPDLSLADGIVPARILQSKHPIEPLFEVKVERTALLLDEGQSFIELALDRGEIGGLEGKHAFAEIELELKRGSTGDLFRLARSLADAAPLRLSYVTKSDRGYRSLAVSSESSVKSTAAALSPRMTSAAAFQAIAGSCLRHLMANEALIRETMSPEAVHQARVALRRLRAAISLFAAANRDEARSGVRAELRWMANQMGEARDLDVYIEKVLEPAQAHRGDDKFVELLADYRQRRQRAYETMAAAVRSPRFVYGALDAAAWVEAGAWLSNPRDSGKRARERPVVEHAREELSRRWRKVRKRSKKLASLEPEVRHRLRIEIKKLRYASDFFGALFKGREAGELRKEALDVLEKLQDILGDLNDVSVGERMSTSALAEEIRREQLERVDALVEQAKALRYAFARLEPFFA